jgi:hypothetical protein
MISDRCVAWVRKWDQKVSSMYEFAGRRRPGRDDYSAGTRDDHHSYGTYLAWHALALAAGDLLKEHPLAELRGYETSWDEWLLKYSITRADGLWLADGTEKYPPVAFHDLLGEGDNRDTPIADQPLLLSLAGINTDLSIGDRPVLAASWSSPDRVDVSIVTAFVPECEAELAARALSTAPPFHMWLPSYRSYDEDDRFGDGEYAPLEAWFFYEESREGLDRRDPLGSRAAVQRIRPAKKVTERFRLSSKDAWSVIWTRPRDLPALTSSAWGVRTGQGQSERWECGTALYADPAFLRLMLKKLDRSLLLLVKLQHYYKKQSSGEDGTPNKGDFIHSWIVASVTKDLKVKLFRENAADAALVAQLPEHSRYSFAERRRMLFRGQS